MALQITFLQGGMLEFQKTGVYPEYLVFNIPGTRKNWRVRIKEKPQVGILKSKGLPLYQYSFNGEFCSYREIKNDGICSKWIWPESMNFEWID